MIANMALDGLEAAVHASVGATRYARKYAKLNVIRYADDFVVTGASKEVLESRVLPAVKAFMAVRGLELSEEKNPDHEHSGRFRFPRSERAQIRRQVTDQASEEKH